MNKKHEFGFSVRVYYEDTDAGGIVYNANYLKFAERARTEFLRSLGINQIDLKRQEKLVFVLSQASMQLKKPAFLDDELLVQTSVSEVKQVSFSMEQHIKREHQLVAKIEVVIASVGLDLRPLRMPPFLREKFLAAK